MFKATPGNIKVATCFESRQPNQKLIARYFAGEIARGMHCDTLARRPLDLEASLESWVQLGNVALPLVCDPRFSAARLGRPANAARSG